MARDATADQIKKAFRKLARKYHPDISKEPDAELRMKEINEANAVLSDVEKRAAYDQLGRGPQPGQQFDPPPGWDSGFEFSGRGGAAGDAADYSDFFAELFGQMGGAHSRARSARAQGEDHHAKVMLDLEDTFTGAVQQISLRVPRQDGSGRVVFDTRTLKVNIPKGVAEGQMIGLQARARRDWAVRLPATCCSKCISSRIRVFAPKDATCI